MLLAVNIGNSSIRFGVFNGRECGAKWIIQTKPHRSADEYAVVLHCLMNEHGIDGKDIDRVVAACVVPALAPVFRVVFREHLDIEPVFVKAAMKTGLRFPIEDPSEMGADLLANAVAALHLYRTDSVVADFGTAMSFTIVRSDGFLPGIVIAPGVVSAMNSLTADTAQLPEIELVKPEKVIGLETSECIRSGVVYGWTGLLERITAGIDSELGTRTRLIITGGSSEVFAGMSDRIDVCDDLHTLRGLQIIAELNP